MATGTVVWFDATKGYGFIAQEASGQPDVFVHMRDLPGYFGAGQKGRERGKRGGFVAVPDPTLEKGQRVEFEIEDGPKGPRAVSVRIIPTERGDPIVGLMYDLGLK